MDNNNVDPTFALACKRLAPMLQMKMIVTWKHDEIDDEDYDVALVYCVNPKSGKVYTQDKVYNSESELLHSFEHFSSVSLSLADLQDEIKKGNIQSIDREHLEEIEKIARNMLGMNNKTENVNESVLFEGGNVFKTPEGPLTQRIDRADIKPTLVFLEKLTGLPMMKNVLGSVGKKASSGDIDVGVDASSISKDELSQRIMVWVKKYHPEDAPRLWVAKSGDSVHFRTPIAGKESKGFVQTDLMFTDDMVFQKFSMASEGDKSAYSGMERNVLLASIAKARGMKWSYKAGLVNRESGETISKDPIKIAALLLGRGGRPEQLLSVESIIGAIKNDPQFGALIADAKDVFAKSGKSLGESKYTDMIRNKSIVKLNELNMAPSKLKSHVSQVGAKFLAGFEAECIFRGLGSAGGEPDYDNPERDMDMNDRISRAIDFDDIKQFFELRRNDRQLEKMRSDFQDYWYEKEQEYISENLESKKQELANNYNNDKEDDDHMLPDEFEQEANEELEESFNDDNEGPDLYDWLRSELNLDDLEAISDYFGFGWPHYTYPESESGDGGYNVRGAEEVSAWLEHATGLPSIVNDTYHGGRQQGMFAIEPDGSLEPDDADDMACEIVSPPLPLPETLEILDKTLQMINSKQGYTNGSTGLHFNLSIADMQLDYVKLVLFLGDAKVLSDFGREAASYAKSSVGHIKQAIQDKTSGSLSLFSASIIDYLERGLASSASKAIMTANNKRTVSVNFHANQNYVEFRSMGGNYSRMWPDIQNTIMRFARALEVACDPEAYKKEYAAKLYKIMMANANTPATPLTIGDTNISLNDTLKNVVVGFSMFQSGQVNKEQLKHILQYRAAQRKGPMGSKMEPKPNLPK